MQDVKPKGPGRNADSRRIRPEPYQWFRDRGALRLLTVVPVGKDRDTTELHGIVLAPPLPDVSGQPFKTK
jgi:hypothetical protein